MMPIEYAVGRWIKLLDPSVNDEIVPSHDSDVIVMIPKKRLDLLKMEMQAFVAGMKQGRGEFE